MHPSKAQKSTAKGPESDLITDSADIHVNSSKKVSGATKQTPSKIAMSSPTFDFRFARPVPQLGPEAQRMMDELRDEAIRIKAKLAAEKEAEEQGGGEQASLGSRKIAQPKGKVGRFSDIHMADFKKMDSIANHPSAFRAQPGRFIPAATSLKRTQSKAKLDDREDSRATMQHESNHTSDRLENSAPAKRMRKHMDDDTSSGRPISRDGGSALKQPSTPSSSRSHSNILASITTPTQASLARAATIKTTQIPTLSRSPSKPNLTGTPRGMTKSATTNNIADVKADPNMQSPSRFDRVKSILRKASGSAKKTSGPSAIPTLTQSPSKPNLHKGLPSLPATPRDVESQKVAKHVNFTPTTINKLAATIQNSPSPAKSGIPRSTSKYNLLHKTSAGEGPARNLDADVQYPTIPGHGGSEQVQYLSLAGVRPLPQPPVQARARTPPLPSVPGTFTFRSDHTINFGTSPKGFGSSPGQASLRQVRQSIFPGDMPGSFPSSDKENMAPAVPHGISKKKRRRADSDDEEEGFAQPSPKKQKSNLDAGSRLATPALKHGSMTPKASTQSPTKKKSGITLSRLNMLARPKLRK